MIRSQVANLETPTEFVKLDQNVPKTMFTIYLMTRGVVDISYLEKEKIIDYKFNIRKSLYPFVRK